MKILIIGAGFYGAVFARELHDAGHQVLVIDKRSHIGGNCYTRVCPETGVNEHVYGPHIFHTSSKDVWDYVNCFADFNNFTYRPKASTGSLLLPLPINLTTISLAYGEHFTPAEARTRIEQDCLKVANPQNVEDWCISHIGRRLYNLLIKGYTEKQWGCPASQVPAYVVQRLPVRFTHDDNYFTDTYQGIPIGGYTALFARLLADIPIQLATDYTADSSIHKGFDGVIYTGPIDALFKYQMGPLKYRSLRFDSRVVPLADFQGVAAVNYTDAVTPCTRTIEHHHFDGVKTSDTKTRVTMEFPQTNGDPYYPVTTEREKLTYKQYVHMLPVWDVPIVARGRLGSFKYYDMHQVIAAALNDSHKLLAQGWAELAKPRPGQ